MIDDPIVEKIRRFRREHTAQYVNNLQRIVEALREKERLSDRVRLNPGPKRLAENVLSDVPRGTKYVSEERYE
ncbi:MAG: hypothetical protein D3920_02155 [Candidatus Electrothrix sp. AW2]|nr:hypothetical protein [Candidatus Electrothrix gigas]